MHTPSSLYYVELGRHSSDIPLILVHGFPFSHEMWKPQLELFERQQARRVIAYDIRGHGRSSVGDGQYTMELFVDDLVELLDHVEIEKAAVCGFSMGGYIVLRAVERNPERFAALALCDTMSVADSDESKLRRATSIKMIKKDGVQPFADNFVKAVFSPGSIDAASSHVKFIKEIIVSNSPPGICGALLAMVSRTDTTEALRKIAVPTLIIVGEHDKLTPPAASEAMHEKIMGSELRVIPNAAHMSNLENPQEFNKHLENFLMNLAK